MRVAVLEYLCGGGLADVSDDEISSVSSLYEEGDAMLAAVVADLIACGHHVTTVLDQRTCERWKPNLGTQQWSHHVQVHTIGSGQSLAPFWLQATESVERVLVVAPEIDQTLENLVQEFRGNGRTIWAPSESFLKTGSDKRLTHSKLQNLIQQPSTWTASEFLGLCHSTETESRSGWVIKPRDGAGCSDMTWHAQRDEALRFLRNLNKVSIETRIVQSWESGQPYSLAMIVNHAGKAKLVGVCEQKITCHGDVKYHGGRGPVLFDSYSQIEAWGRSVLDLIPGAIGWVGIDFLLSKRSQDPLLIEVNPRLTTSYLAYRKVYGPRLAEELLGLANSLEWQDLGRSLPFDFRVGSKY